MGQKVRILYCDLRWKHGIYTMINDFNLVCWYWKQVLEIWVGSFHLVVSLRRPLTIWLFWKDKWVLPRRVAKSAGDYEAREEAKWAIEQKSV